MRGRRIALLVELTEGADFVADLARGKDTGRAFHRRSIRLLGGRVPKMAGDIASGDVHGLQTKKPRKRGFCKGYLSA
jgi:hypothetical protein